MRLSFRTRLLIALPGTLLPLLGIALLVVQVQTQKQVRAFTNAAVQSSRRTFAEVEAINRDRLAALGQRFAQSSRTAALLQASLYEEPDPAFNASQLMYELGLAGADSALVALTDLEARPLGTVLAASALADPGNGVPADLLERVIARSDTVGFGYHVIGTRIYSVYLALLRVVDQPLGFIVVGLPITDQTAATIGSALNAEVCFVARAQCLAATPGLQQAGLTREDLAAAVRGQGPLELERDGAHWRLIPDTTMAADHTVSSVIALRLDAVLAPFTAIRIAIAMGGAVALLLAIVIGVLLLRGLVGPVRALVAATARVAKGDFSVSVEAPGADELATLARAFNDMTHDLRLKEQYRGLLDKVVSADVAEEMLRGEIKLGGENREVTTVFADLRGFTALTEGMEPQVVIHTLNEVMDRASAAIEAEGGVVDKYVGDEVMGVFGAPVARPDDTLRAVRAALGIRDAVATLSAERVARGERALAIGVGVSTGLVVAGNMGSERRLNYTVLGESVNVAARLCADAGPQEILLAESTYSPLRDSLEAEHAGARSLRGMSQPVQVYRLERIREARPASFATSAVLLLALCATAASLSAQQPLVSVANASGSVQATLGTRLELTGYAPADEPTWLVESTRPFLAPRASLFADAFLGSHLQLTSELRVDRGEAPADRPLELRIEQLYARLFPINGVDLNLQAGKFVSPFGAYPQRHHTAADPLIRPPLPYEQRTMICAYFVPRTNDGFIGWKDRPDIFRAMGAPPVWGAPYQVGAMLFGSVGPGSYRVAVMNSAPSSEPAEWDRIADTWKRPSFVAHLGFDASPELALGVSYNRGPYMLEKHIGGDYPAGTTAEDYYQELVGVDATFARGPLQLRAEAIYDTWAVPNAIDDAVDISYFGEAALKLSPGLFAAARYGAIHYQDMRLSSGTPVPWDYDVRRWQIGAGYHLTTALQVRAEYLISDMVGPLDPADNLFSVQVSYDH